VIELPAFPLRTVLFPGTALRLRIFEPRYLDMVSRCLREDVGFVVVLIRAGSEVGPATTHEIGTLARIADWDRMSDGLLGITARGVERVRLHASRRQPDGLLLAQAERLGPDPTRPVEARHTAAIAALESLRALAGDGAPGVERIPDDAAGVAARLAPMLPVSALEKQGWLEIDDPVARLDAMMPAVTALRPRRPRE
jgi:uncharacterized protein